MPKIEKIRRTRPFRKSRDRLDSSMKEAVTPLLDFLESSSLHRDAFPKVLFDSIRAIIASLDERDPYTHGHSLRVAEFSVLLAKALMLPKDKVNEIELTALLHDIGKIGIPDHVLLKPDRLSKSEFDIMKSHPVRSARIVEKIPALKHLLPGIKNHHERFDGLGYPNGLTGKQIPLPARIVLIADTYDAMTSTRPYRLALNRDVAFDELRRCAGTQFDPALVESFIEAIKAQDHKPVDQRKTYHKKVA